MRKIPNASPVSSLNIEALQSRIRELETENFKLKQFSSELTANEQNLSVFFNTIDYLLFVLDTQGNILLSNQTVSRRLGYSSGELFGQSVLMVHPPERREEAARIVNEMLAGKADYCPIPLLTREGELVPVETRVSAGKWNGQDVIFGVTKDITDIKSSEEKFAKAFRACPVPMAITDLQNGKYVDVNDSFLQILEFTREDVIGKTAAELNMFVNPEQRTALLQQMSLNGFLRNEKVLVNSKHGNIRVGLFSAEYIQLQDGKYLLTVMNDVTERTQNEDALRKAQARYHALFDLSYDAIMIVDLDGKHLEVNRRAVEMLGYSREELLALSAWDISAEPSHIFPVIERLLNGEQIPVYERFFRKKDGGCIPVEVSVQVVRDGNAQPIHFQISVRDITERKKVETALRQSDARWQFALEGSGDGVWDWNVQTGEVFYSKQWKAMLGYEEEEIQNSLDEWEQRVHPDDLMYVKSEINAYFEGQSQIYVSEHRVRCKDDEYIWVLDRGKIIEWTEDKKPLRMIGTHTDITDRIRAEQRMRENEMRYRIVAENTHDWAFWLSPKGEFLYSSPSCKQVTGYDAVEFLRDENLLLRIIDPEDRSLYIAHHQEVYESKTRGECEFRIEMLDGSIRWINHVCQPIFDDLGNYLGTRGSNRDVTLRKRTAISLGEANRQLRIQLNEIEKLEAELREQAMHDPLTGLYNRRHLTDALERDLLRAVREKKPLSVIIMDVDRFKGINDTYGHHVGDQFLIEIANLLLHHARRSDIACRYGGEEFLLVMPGASARSAQKRAEEIRLACSSVVVLHGNDSLNVTVSMGVAAYPDCGKNALEILVNADKALYYSKHSGRNRVTVWDEKIIGT